jgi:hypothetical protein
MIYYANPCVDAARDAMLRGELGCITTPSQGNVTFPAEWDTIADNGCFSGQWTERAWFSWLLDLPRTIRWAVCPDVFDPSGAPCHEPTVERWNQYAPKMMRHGFTPAFVAQVGCTPNTIPTDVEVLFLGGTTKWKLSHNATCCVAEIRRRGGWAHMGRVNSERRLTAARSMGCDSVDGTYLTFGPDVNLPKLLGWLDRASAQPMLEWANQ